MSRDDDGILLSRTVLRCEVYAPLDFIVSPAGRVCAVLLVLGLLSCGGGGADDTTVNSKIVPVAKFQFNECKTAKSSGPLLTGRDTSDYAGLECVAWDFQSADRKIDLINRKEGCGFQGYGGDETLWTPSAEQLGPNDLTLTVEWKFEYPNACGNCFHDFSVDLRPLSTSASMMLQIATRSCLGGCSWSRDAITLPLSREPAGIRCRYVDWNTGIVALNSDAWAPGKLHMPPMDGMCDSPLIPVMVASGSSICLAPCTQNSDCPSGDLLICRESTCQLAKPWE